MAEPVQFTRAAAASVMFHRMIVVAGGVIAVVGLVRMATTTGPLLLNVGLFVLGGVWVAFAGSTCYELSIRSEGVAAKAVLGERVIPAPYEIEYIPRRLEGLLPSYFVQGRIRIRPDARGTHGYHRLAAGPWPELAMRRRLEPPH